MPAPQTPSPNPASSQPPGTPAVHQRNQPGTTRNPVDDIMHSISEIESGHDYSAVGVQTSHGRALGRYQIMSDFFDSWAEEAGLSNPNWKNPEHQDTVARHRISNYWSEFQDPELVAVAWFAGPQAARNLQQGDESILNRRDALDTDVNQYISRFNSALPEDTQAVATASAQQGRVQADLSGMVAGAGRTIGVWEDPNPTDPVSPQTAAQVGNLDAAVSEPGDLGVPASQQPIPQGTHDVSASAFIEEAKNYIGTPYVWGGDSPDGLDCSGLVQLAAANVGVELPRVSREQAQAGEEVSLEQAQPGDLIAFPSRGHEVGHIGIVTGRNDDGELTMLHAPRAGKNVKVEPIGDREVATVRRVFQPDVTDPGQSVQDPLGEPTAQTTDARIANSARGVMNLLDAPDAIPGGGQVDQGADPSVAASQLLSDGQAQDATQQAEPTEQAAQAQPAEPTEEPV